MILGYAEQPSPRAGEAVRLRVATDAPAFRIEVHRFGTGMALRARSGWLPGRDAPVHLPFQDWGRPGTGLRGEALPAWPAYRVPVPGHWRSGVYVAVLVEGDGEGRDLTDPDRSTPDARTGRVAFVVRPATPTAAILYKLPVLTYQAYNLGADHAYDPETGSGSWCLYNVPRPAEVPVPVPDAVGLHRPGGATGGNPYDVLNIDPFDPSPRQTLVHWDARFISWMEREGYEVDYCTDVDLHRQGRCLLNPYRLLVSAGHDEYWSEEMRAALETFVEGGGNAAFFSGNTCWWQVRFSDPVTFARTGFWHEAGRPENTAIGVSFRNGGERDRDDHPVPVGYRVQHADHWVYAGTRLRNGDVLGGGPRDHLVGYECDGADFDRADLRAGRPVTPTGADGTPAGFTILGVADLEPYGWGFGNAAATMGVLTHGGTVFNAATTDWPRVLTDGRCPEIGQITRTVLDRLGDPGPQPAVRGP